jgi:hypothetical protein
MPSSIVMDAIDAIIVQCQSACKTSPSNATRKAMAISLEAKRQPCQQMQQRRCESVVSNTTKLNPVTTIIVTGASTTAMQVGQMQP